MDTVVWNEKYNLTVVVTGNYKNMKKTGSH